MNDSAAKSRFPFLQLLQGASIGILFGALVSTFPYYTIFTHIFVCGVAIYTAYAANKNKSILWTGIFGALAIQYNPVHCDPSPPIHLLAIFLILCESSGTRSRKDWLAQCKARLIILLYMGGAVFMADIWAAMLLGSSAAIYVGITGYAGSVHSLSMGWRAFWLLFGLLFALGLLLSAQDVLKKLWVAAIEEITGKVWTPETSADFEMKFPEMVELISSPFFHLALLSSMVGFIVLCFKQNPFVLLLEGIVVFVIGLPVLGWITKVGSSEITLLRARSFGMLIAIVGLVVLCFNHNEYVLLPEGLLLIAIGVQIFYWLRRYSHDVIGPRILRNPINQILYFLGSITAIGSGLVMLWSVNQLIAYGLAAFLFVRHVIRAHLDSEERAISQTVGAYKELKKTSPDKDEQQLLRLTYRDILLMWGERDERASYLKDKEFKSLHDVVASLLIYKDVHTGSIHMKDDVFSLTGFKKREQRKEFIEKLLR